LRRTSSREGRRRMYRQRACGQYDCNHRADPRQDDPPRPRSRMMSLSAGHGPSGAREDAGAWTQGNVPGHAYSSSWPMMTDP
jgi:hypothetical protein